MAYMRTLYQVQSAEVRFGVRDDTAERVPPLLFCSNPDGMCKLTQVLALMGKDVKLNFRKGVCASRLQSSAKPIWSTTWNQFCGESRLNSRWLLERLGISMQIPDVD